MPDIPATDCNTVTAALTAAALAVAAAAIAVSAFAIAYITKTIHEWRTWQK